MNSGSFRIRVSMTCVILLLLAAPVAAFEVSYGHYCYATSSDGIPIMDDDVLTGQSYVDGDYIKTGAHGNFGAVVYYADISTATVSAYAHSHGVQTGPYSFPSGTGRVNKIMFRDQLTFTVPAGYYPDGVQVSLHGTVVGTISADVGAGAQAQCLFSLGADNFDTSLLGVDVSDSGTIQVDESFTLTAELVSPGTTLVEATEYDESVAIGFHNGHTWSTSYNPGGGNVIGDGDLDFINGLRFTALDVPAGVSWTSESGMFPYLPTAVPEDEVALPTPRLQQNHPNPFNPRTTISFDVPRPMVVSLNVYDLSGRLIRTLLRGEIVAEGVREAIWDARDSRGRPMSSGTYFYRLETGDFSETKRMMLIR